MNTSNDSRNNDNADNTDENNGNPITYENPNFVQDDDSGLVVNKDAVYFNTLNNVDSFPDAYVSIQQSIRSSTNSNINPYRNSTSSVANMNYVVSHDNEIRPVSHNINDNDRESWSDKMDFVFNAIGYVMGLGNIWKFPFYVVKYGGGFCIVYALFFFLFGIPTVLLEIYIGQFTSRGGVQCWGQSALLRSIGLGMVVKTFIELQPYTMITVRTFKYIILSFNPNKYIYNETLQKEGISSFQYYLENDGFGIGQLTTYLGNFGNPKYELVISGLITWAILFLCLLIGLKYSGKIIYGTVIIPAFLLIILLFHALGLKGSVHGVNKYFNKLNFNKPEMWVDAAVQIMFSMGIASAGMNTLASYRKFKAELIGTTILISCVDFCASLIGSLIVLSFLGNVEINSNYARDENSLSEYTLLFSVIPQAIMDNATYLPVLWLVLLFLTMLTLAFDTTIPMYRVVICGFFEVFGYPAKEKEKYFYLGFSLLGFVFCIPMCCPGGKYWEAQIGNGLIWGYIITELLLFTFVIFFYGGKNISDDIECMTKNTNAKKIWSVIKWYFMMCWYFWIPAIFIAIMILKMLTYTWYSIPGKIVPVWMHFFEVFITLCVFLSIIIYIVYHFIKLNGATVKDKFKTLIITDVNKPLWYPATESAQKEIKEFKRGKCKGCIVNTEKWTINTTN